MKLNEIYNYPKAGLNASNCVKKEIEKFRALPNSEKETKPLLYHLLGSGTPKYKMSKKDSNYVDESQIEGQTCGNCKFAYKKVIKDRFICSQISGPIKLAGWCKLWKSG